MTNIHKSILNVFKHSLFVVLLSIVFMARAFLVISQALWPLDVFQQMSIYKKFYAVNAHIPCYVSAKYDLKSLVTVGDNHQAIVLRFPKGE